MQTIQKTKSRESNFELLRLVLMFMIIVHHGIVHGLKISSIASGEELTNSISTCLIGGGNCLLIIAVNVFILISGYFSIKPTKKKVASLLIQLFTYTFFLNALPYLILKGDIKTFLLITLFISHSPYWFMIDYLILFCFAPMLNEYLDRMNKRQHLLFASLFLFVSCYLGFVWGHAANSNGYTIFNFITLYIIGRYLKIYNLSVKTWIAIAGYLSLSLCSAAGFILLYKLGMGSKAWHMTYYNSPLVIGASVCFFLVFKNLRIQSERINILSKSSLATYLISSSLLGGVFYKEVALQFQNNGDMAAISTIIVGAIIFMLLAFIIDPIYRQAYTIVCNKTGHSLSTDFES